MIKFAFSIWGGRNITQMPRNFGMGKYEFCQCGRSKRRLIDVLVFNQLPCALSVFQRADNANNYAGGDIMLAAVGLYPAEQFFARFHPEHVYLFKQRLPLWLFLREPSPCLPLPSIREGEGF